jgi:uncharacterized OB-fold protein
MSDASAAGEPTLSAPHRLEYTYKRSLGAVLGRFFTGLRDHKIEGVKTKAGEVLIPPAEYDPQTGDATTDEWVEVGPSGTVTTWAWVNRPSDKHPLDHPFAFALVKLDGADTPLMHVVDAGSEDNMKTGMRVTVKWADETIGRIEDIACFVAEDA